MITRETLTENLKKYAEYCKQCTELERQIAALYTPMDELYDKFIDEEKDFYAARENVDLF